jgi:hypothetical protein
MLLSPLPGPGYECSGSFQGLGSPAADLFPSFLSSQEGLAHQMFGAPHDAVHRLFDGATGSFDPNGFPGPQRDGQPGYFVYPPLGAVHVAQEKVDAPDASGEPAQRLPELADHPGPGRPRDATAVHSNIDFQGSPRARPGGRGASAVGRLRDPARCSGYGTATQPLDPIASRPVMHPAPAAPGTGVPEGRWGLQGSSSWKHSLAFRRDGVGSFSNAGHREFEKVPRLS